MQSVSTISPEVIAFNGVLIEQLTAIIRKAASSTEEVGHGSPPEFVTTAFAPIMLKKSVVEAACERC